VIGVLTEIHRHGGDDAFHRREVPNHTSRHFSPPCMARLGGRARKRLTNDSVGSNKGPLPYSLHRRQLLDCYYKQAAARRSLCRPCRRSKGLVGLTCSGQDMVRQDTGLRGGT
jgi:hypothetical protein